MAAHSDVERVLAHRGDGADYWATPDGRIYVGNPFSTISSLLILHELGASADVLRFFPEFREENEAIDQAVESLLDHWEDRAPRGPCHHGIGSNSARSDDLLRPRPGAGGRWR